LGTIREHLIQNKRHADFRVWRGSRNRDSSDDEWEESFWVLAGEHTAQVVKQVDTRRMVEETFQQANENFTLDERVQEVALDAFHVADIVHKKCMRNGFEDVEDLSDLTAEEPISNSGKGGIAQDSNFNPHVVEDALKPLYRGAKSTELASTILLLYLCMVDGMSNNFTKELFALLYGHLLLVDNCLPRNYYGARSLTSKLGFSYQSIHACKKWCILFYQEHSEALHCLECGGPRYWDEHWKMFPLKVLRHFPVTPRL
jgi:hypothetical protein